MMPIFVGVPDVTPTYESQAVLYGFWLMEIIIQGWGEATNLNIC